MNNEIFDSQNSNENKIIKFGMIELTDEELKVLVKKLKNKFIIESCNLDGTVNFELSPGAKEFLKNYRNER